MKNKRKLGTLVGRYLTERKTKTMPLFDYATLMLRAGYTEEEAVEYISEIAIQANVLNLAPQIEEVHKCYRGI
jgi:hypothetical protein